MVLPFFTVYMTASLGYSVQHAGIVMSLYGIGSMLGSYLGGRFTDKIGPFNVMLMSLFAGGASYVILPFISDIIILGAAVFICATINEALRPANSSMVAHFASSEMYTRSFSLLRMAINLGVTIGPMVAGILAGVSYKLLFFGDALTNIGAGVLFYLYFKNKKPAPHPKAEAGEEKGKSPVTQSPYTDGPYLLFIGFCLLYAIAFFQIFSGLPLYYKDVYLKSESTIGLLLGFNGLIVFIFEMITVYSIEKRYRPVSLIITGSLMLGISFILFNFWQGTAILIISMLLLSFSEIFAMPFMISHVVSRSKPETRGSYLASYTIAWSLALILAPALSSQVIAHYNFTMLWWLTGIICLITAVGFGLLMKRDPDKPKPLQ